MLGGWVDQVDVGEQKEEEKEAQGERRSSGRCSTNSAEQERCPSR